MNRGAVELRRWLAGDDTGIKVSQGQLATRLGVKQEAICHWIRGRNRPNYDRRMALERETGIPAAAWGELTEVAGKANAGKR